MSRVQVVMAPPAVHHWVWEGWGDSGPDTPFEVANPILSGPFDPPQEHWQIELDRPAVRMPGRRKAGYFYRPPTAPGTTKDAGFRGPASVLAASGGPCAWRGKVQTLLT